jgi:hypothetical protein
MSTRSLRSPVLASLLALLLATPSLARQDAGFSLWGAGAKRQPPPEPQTQPEEEEDEEQEQPPADEPQPPPGPETPGLPSSEEQAATTGPEDPQDEEEPPAPPSERNLPRLDVYFPEGELDLRVNRLINKVFFEGQVKYNFIEGDITAFLRYRYYGLRRTTQFTVFDAIEFDDIDDDVKDDFDRVRGTLLLFQWPYSYNHRSFFLAELDRVSSNKPGELSRLELLGDTNTFVRVGYQLGTPDENRSSAIAGETRARTERLFSAFREFGPGDSTLTAAVTYGFDLGGLGDFRYVKLEFEALKRFDLSPRTFLVGRLRGGTFPSIGEVSEGELPPEADPVFDRYTIPRSEFLRLDGREYLKGLDERVRGIEQLLTTWEYFIPWFIEERRDFLRLEWQNWYWVLYAGAGTVGFDREIYTDFDTYIPDAGIGFESSFRLRKYRFFLSGIVAQALKGDGGVEAHISVKSYR